VYYTLTYQDNPSSHPPLFLFTSKLDITWIANDLNKEIQGPGFFRVQKSAAFEDYGRDAVREMCKKYADY